MESLTYGLLYLAFFPDPNALKVHYIVASMSTSSLFMVE